MLKVFLTTRNSETIKPFFLNKGLNTNNIIVVENNNNTRGRKNSKHHE